MFRDNTQFDLLPFGYEYTNPELVRYTKKLKKQKDKTWAKVSGTPDFILLPKDRKKVYLVEVKYLTDIKANFRSLKTKARKMVKYWDEVYFFVATPGGFYFDTGVNFSTKKLEEISELPVNFIPKKIQNEFLLTLKEFLQLGFELNSSYQDFVKFILYCQHCGKKIQFDAKVLCPYCKKRAVEFS